MNYLILGNKGQLGREFDRILMSRSASYLGFDLDTLDMADELALNKALYSIKPGIILNCAAFTDVDLAELNPGLAMNTNRDGVRTLAKYSAASGAFLVHFSTDYVFGTENRREPYIESDIPAPVNNYGLSKLAGEREVLENLTKYLVLRLSWVYGEGRQNFIRKFLEWSSRNDLLRIAEDEVSVPTSASLIATTVMEALDKGLEGLYHLTAGSYASRYEWALKIASILGLKNQIEPVSKSIFGLPARRPDFSAMDSTLLSKSLSIEFPSWENVLEKFLLIQRFNY